MPKLRSGVYSPEFLLQPRRRAEQALMAVVCQAYVEGVSTRRVDDLVKAMGIDGISKSEVSRMAAELDAKVTEFKERPLDQGPYRYLWIDALTQRVREGGRVVNISMVIATATNAEGRREIVGFDVVTTEDTEAWTAFLRSLVARGLSGIELVISDAHGGIKAAIGTVFSEASWQRCRTHFMANLASRVPKASWPMIATLVRSIFEQPDRDTTWSELGDVVDKLTEAGFNDVAVYLLDAADDILAFSAFPFEHWPKIRSNNPWVILSPRNIHVPDVQVCDLDGVFDAVFQDGPRAAEIFSVGSCFWPAWPAMTARLTPSASARASRRRRLSLWSSWIRSLATSSRRAKEASEIFCRSGMSAVVEFWRPRRRSISPRSSVWV